VRDTVLRFGTPDMRREPRASPLNEESDGEPYCDLIDGLTYSGQLGPAMPEQPAQPSADLECISDTGRRSTCGLRTFAQVRCEYLHLRLYRRCVYPGACR
jgi:hypothetical protein